MICDIGANGTFTVVARGQDLTPLGGVSAAQLLHYNLTYPTQNPMTISDFPSYTCTSGLIGLTPAGGNLTVDSHLNKL
jgi:hypothetical protein